MIMDFLNNNFNTEVGLTNSQELQIGSRWEN